MYHRLWTWQYFSHLQASYKNEREPTNKPWAGQRTLHYVDMATNHIRRSHVHICLRSTPSQYSHTNTCKQPSISVRKLKTDSVHTLLPMKNPRLFQDFPGPKIFKIKIQDLPGNVGTLNQKRCKQQNNSMRLLLNMTKFIICKWIPASQHLTAVAFMIWPPRQMRHWIRTNVGINQLRY